MHNKITINEVQERFKNLLSNQFELVERVSMLSKAFPTNFTPSGGEERLNTILQELDPKASFCAIQPCFRYQDIERIHTGFHLPLFHMGIAVSVNTYAPVFFINKFLTFFDSLGFDRSKLKVSVFDGGKVMGKFLSRDTTTADIWIKHGIHQDQLVYYGTDENYFLLKKQGYGGVKTEAFYYYNNQWIELSVILKLTHSVKETPNGDYYIDKYNNDVTCWGIGTERWATIINGELQITSLKEYKTLVEKYELPASDIQKVILLSLSLALLFSDGARIHNGTNGRRRLLKKILRKLLKAIQDSEISFCRYYDLLLPDLLIKQEEFMSVRFDKSALLKLFRSNLEKIYENQKGSMAATQ